MRTRELSFDSIVSFVSGLIRREVQIFLPYEQLRGFIIYLALNTEEQISQTGLSSLAKKYNWQTSDSLSNRVLNDLVDKGILVTKQVKVCEGRGRSRTIYLINGDTDEQEVNDLREMSLNWMKQQGKLPE